MFSSMEILARARSMVTSPLRVMLVRSSVRVPLPSMAKAPAVSVLLKSVERAIWRSWLSVYCVFSVMLPEGTLDTAYTVHSVAVPGKRVDTSSSVITQWIFFLL